MVLRATIVAGISALILNQAHAADGEQYSCDVGDSEPVMRHKTEEGTYAFYAPPLKGVFFVTEVTAIELLRSSNGESKLGDNLGMARLMRDGVSIRVFDRAEWTSLSVANKENQSKVAGVFSSEKTESEYGFSIDPLLGNGLLTVDSQTKYRLTSCEITPVHDLPTLEFVPDESE